MEHVDLLDAIDRELEAWEEDDPGRLPWEALRGIVEEHSTAPDDSDGPTCIACSDPWPCKTAQIAMDLFEDEVDHRLGIEEAHAIALLMTSWLETTGRLCSALVSRYDLYYAALCVALSPERVSVCLQSRFSWEEASGMNFPTLMYAFQNGTRIRVGKYTVLSPFLPLSILRWDDQGVIIEGVVEHAEDRWGL